MEAVNLIQKTQVFKLLEEGRTEELEIILTGLVTSLPDNDQEKVYLLKKLF